MKIYAIEIQKNIDTRNVNLVSAFITADKKFRANRYHHYSDALKLIFSDLLIRYLLINKYGINNEDISFSYNKYGKPSVQGIDNFHFNISHSGKWIVCAIDDSQIGIDIEKIISIELDIAKQYFSESEYIDLMKTAEENKLEYFYDLWTLKESYIKANGMGLSLPLNSFTIRKNDGRITFECVHETNEYFLKQYDIDSEYKLSVCALHNDFSQDVTNVKMDKIIETFLYMR